jgi:hypothetical protein
MKIAENKNETYFNVDGYLRYRERFREWYADDPTVPDQWIGIGVEKVGEIAVQMGEGALILLPESYMKYFTGYSGFVPNTDLEGDIAGHLMGVPVKLTGEHEYIVISSGIDGHSYIVYFFRYS